MKLSKFDEISQLVQILKNLKSARKECITFSHDVKNKGQHLGSVEGFDIGYYCHLSRHSDGSGVGINMSGCYIAVEVSNSILNVINIQIQIVESRLEELGVEVDTEQE